MISFFKKLFLTKHKRSTLEEKWLSQSESYSELHRKQEMLKTGKSPWQVEANTKLRSLL